ncbi:hypothetical protein [Lentzea fradiae]|uniref:hypothetical protein n=1 Tax=Lentzea fradiae TaxID=200378 RepID=UPI000B7FCCAC|nr:hypothetical protein [Lentzea fradiae]
MRWPALLLALLLAFVGTSTRHAEADQPGTGLNAPVSAVHVHTTSSGDACWAVPCACGGSQPPSSPALAVLASAESAEGTTSGPWSSRAPPQLWWCLCSPYL